jgi:hypothetical protein
MEPPHLHAVALKQRSYIRRRRAMSMLLEDCDLITGNQNQHIISFNTRVQTLNLSRPRFIIILNYLFGLRKQLEPWSLEDSLFFFFIYLKPESRS